MLRKLSLIVASLALLFAVTGGDVGVVPVDVAYAQVDTGLEDIGDEAGLGQQDLRVIIARIIRVFLTLLGMVAVIIVIYAGFLWMTAAGNDEKVDKAKRILLQGVIGLTIILLSYAITTFVFNALLGATGANIGGGNGSGGSGGGTGSGLGGGAAATFVVADFVPEGDVAIRNIEYQITFTRVINETTVDGNVTITQADTGVVVEGTYETVGSKVVFTPAATCPEPNEDRFCFDENTTFNVTVSTDLEDSGGRNLDCSVTDSCLSSFTTGSLVDIEDPSVDIVFPDAGDSFEPGTVNAVQVAAEDDAAVAVADFYVNDVLFDSVAAAGDDLTSVIIDTLWDNTGLLEGQRYPVEVVVTDIAGNEDDDRITVKINPAYCYNGVLDEDDGETDIDCGGDCGSCAGGSCVEDIDCAAGACIEGICTTVPVMFDISPVDGAPGTLVTISGEHLGALGNVFFTAEDGLLVEGNTNTCGDGWEPDQIIVEVPEGAVDGPLLIQTNLGLSDATDDDRGPIVPDFDVNDVVRPGLCRLSPDAGRTGNSIDLVGVGFNDNQDDSVITFGGVEVSTVIDWTNDRIEVVVPSQDAGDYDVMMTVNGTDSNAVTFEHLAASEAGAGGEEAPSISFLEPDAGGVGQYVTIAGSGFGGATGQVVFEHPTLGYEAIASIDFPDACADDFWKPSEVTVIVPETYTNEVALETTTHNVTVVHADPDVPPSNSIAFLVTDADPTPGVCAIDPDQALPGEEVTIIGDGFGGGEGEAIFYNEVGSTVLDWSDGEVVVSVAGAAQTGPVRIKNAAGQGSNAVNFAVGGGEGQGDDASVVGTYSWTFSTGDIPQVPQLVVVCNDDQVSAVPNQQFSTDVCVNSVIHAEFDMTMDHGSFVDGNSVLVERCDDDACNDRTLLTGAIDLSSGDMSTSMTWQNDAGDFDTGTTYVVTVTTGVTNTAFPAIALLNDVSWQFTTRDSDEDCVVQSVRVSPSTEELNEEGQTTEFVALPSGQDACVVLNATDYTWDWDVDNSIAAIDASTFSCAEIEGDHCALVTALAEGETLVTTEENFSGEFGSATLTIDFTDPYVADQWPDCSTACIDAQVGARFNTGMSTAIEDAGMVTLHECANELCLTFVDTIADSAVCVYDDELNCTEVFVAYTGSLKENAYYRTVISGAVASTSDIPLTRTNYGSDYSWTFSTKQDNASCSISYTELSPLDAVLDTIGETQHYTVTAYGEPDECSAAGQRLNAHSYDWNWEDPIIDEQEIASWMKIDGRLFDATLTDLPNGCTASCLATGSEPFSALCGDGVIGLGEECDDANVANGDGCSDICLREGDGTVGVCGDGILDRDGLGAGEDCDDGNLVDGDGCSAQCLNEGSRVIGAACGNGNIGYDPTVGGEDCDDGNTRSGDGCSSQCLFEGSVSAAEVVAVCGNTIIEPGETCDDGNAFDGDGCSSRCLREGSDVFGSFATCGDGVLQQNANGSGEDCDDGNTESGDGCSSLCLAEGSSVSYDLPSVCGDGETGVGELIDPGLGSALCEEGVSPDGEPDPVQVAEIIDTAVNHVDIDAQLATTTIRVEEADAGIATSTTLNLRCVAENETQCPDPYAHGVTTASCCMERPEATLFPNGANVCRNAAVYAEFSQRMDTSSFSDNAFLRLDTSTGGICPEGHDIYSPSLTRLPDTFFGRMLRTVTSMFVGFAQAQEEGDCIVPIDTFRQTEQDDGTFKVSFQYSTILAENGTYEVVLDVDGDPFDGFVTGILNSLGVAVYDSAGHVSTSFTTSDEICQLDSVEVMDTNADSPAVFRMPNEQHSFVATAYSFSGPTRQEIEPLPGVYEWTWRSWEEDSGGVIVSIDAETDERADISSQETSGEATVLAQAVVTTDEVFGGVDEESGEGKTVAGDLDVATIICNNPWPSFTDLPFIDGPEGTVTGTTLGNGWMNVSTWYCRDAGDDSFNDDLADMSVVAPPTAGTPEVLKEYLFKIDDDSGDAIGFRVLSNEEYLNPLDWYYAQGFAGSPSERDVDGFQAIEDGRTVYISSPNVVTKTGAIYSNIYVFSYNEGASADTIGIFNQMIDHVRLATNVEDIGLCYNGEAYTAATCSMDSDCNTGAGETCGDKKSQLRRDNRRLTDLKTIGSAVETYGATSGRCSATADQVCASSLDCPAAEICEAAFPTLPSGTFIRGLDSSAWNSWVETLQAQVGRDIPQDPLNQYLGCGEGAYAEYDAATCVNQVAGTYICPVGSHVYHYRSQGPFSFELAAELEYSDGKWQNAISASDTYEIVVGNAGLGALGGLFGGDGFSRFGRPAAGFTVDPAYCDGSTVYGASSTCGDGLVGVDELCEIGQTGAADVCDVDLGVDSDGDGDPTNDASGTIARLCNATCDAFEENPEATCLPIQCGNGVLDPGEDCDDGSFNGRYGFCGNDCTDGTRFYCGDGAVAGGESCDCGDGNSGLTFGGGACTLANGAYADNPANSCAWDCSGPAAFCGDGVIEAGEQCDSNVDTYGGALCDDGSSTQCTSDEDCDGLSLCGGTPSADVCPLATVCIAGANKKLGAVCTSDGQCDSAIGANDGACSTQAFQTTRTKTCADGADGAYSCTWNDDWDSIRCRAPLNCGNGAIDEGEQCDDGNLNNTDGCTNECLANVCGDGFIYAGIEDCDEGGENGILCEAGYEGNCSFCSDSCRLLGASGAFCGDGVMNGGEFCDAGDLPFYFVNADGETNGTCDPTDEGSSFDDGFHTYYCADLGVCNGGTDAGEVCSNSTDVSLTCSGGGSCVYPECSNMCTASCPLSLVTESLAFEGNLLGVGRTTSINLLDKERADQATVIFDSSSATVYVPACTVYDDLVLTLDDSERVYPDVEVMFVVDKSLSMGASLGDSTRIEIVRDVVLNASTTLFEAYDGIDGEMSIGLSALFGVHGTGDVESPDGDTDGGGGPGDVGEGGLVGGDDGGIATIDCGDGCFAPPGSCDLLCGEDIIDDLPPIARDNGTKTPNRFALTDAFRAIGTSLTSVKERVIPFALAVYDTFFGEDHYVNTEGAALSSDESTVSAAVASVLSSASGPEGTPLYGSIEAAANAFSNSDSVKYMVVFTDGNVQNDPDLGLRTSPPEDLVGDLTFSYLGNPTDLNGDGDIRNEEYLEAVTAKAEEIKNNDVKIFTALLYSGNPVTNQTNRCNIAQMSRWSSLSCVDNGDSCSGLQNEGNVDCSLGPDGIQYAYAGTTAEELDSMYEQIVSSILNYTVSITYEGETAVTNIPAGTNRTIDLPSNFVCDAASEQGVTLTTSFGGGGTLNVTSGSLEICSL